MSDSVAKNKTRNRKSVANPEQNNSEETVIALDELKFLGDVDLKVFEELVSSSDIHDSLVIRGISSLIIHEMAKYIGETEIPLLGEFCIQKNYFENLVCALGNKDKNLKLTLKVLENKKRSALERKIYDGELNATIGAHLLKTWREEDEQCRCQNT